jgi:AraC-like DNA-binding protein
MVCDRCKLVIKNSLAESGLEPISVELGLVDLGDAMPDSKVLDDFRIKIEKLGFELLDDKTSKIIDKIKTLIIEAVHYSKNPLNIKLSNFLKNNLNYDYNYLSNLFSSVEGTTIENYYILQKIERTKELLSYDELNLNQISDRLGYSSASHLSSQFKKVTGISSGEFKKIKGIKHRISLDNL